MARRNRRRQWGKGSVYETAGGWGIRWREGDQRRRRAGFATRDDAERVLDAVMGRVALDDAGMPPEPVLLPTLSALSVEWLTRRKITHRCGAEDGYRWKRHLAPYFGHLRPDEVDVARIRTFVVQKLAEGANPATVRVYIAILSALFNELVEQGKLERNPVLALPRSVRRLMKPTHDPRTTPFVERLSDVRRIFLALEEPLSVAYAIGALAGLRTGEVFALRWEHVDLPAQRIHVRESVKGPLKDKDSRVVPILDALAPVLKAWHVKTGGKGRVIPPLRRDGQKVDKATPGNALRKALVDLGLAREGLGWYEATRHTFASHWVLQGRSIEKLSKILGHYSIVVTERYAHLRPDLFVDEERAALPVDLTPGEAEPRQLGPRMAHEAESAPSMRARRREEMPEPPCKPGSVLRPESRSGEHSSRARVAARLQRA
jgi:integrase